MTTRQRTGKSGKNPESSGKKPKAAPPFSGRYNPKFMSSKPVDSANGTFLTHPTLTRFVTLGCCCIVAYFFMHKESHLATMAKQSEILEDKRALTALCAPAYKREIEALKNPKCLPAKCGRMVVDKLIQEEELEDLLKVAKKGLAKGGSNGGASILDLHSGALSEGEAFVNLYKKYPETFTKADFEIYSQVKNKVKAAVSEHFAVDPESLYLSHPTFFSRITSEEAKTLHDEYWHVHVDKETYPSFHITSLLYLTDYGIDFKGGRFIFVDGEDKMNRTIEPRVGRVSAFTSGVENKHYVEKIASGTRYALTMGFTCDKSKAIPDPGSQQQ